MVRENAAKTGSHFWYVSRSPPAIVVRAGTRAPAPPPLTGASREASPFPARCPAISLFSPGSPVPWLTTIRPGRRASSTPGVPRTSQMSRSSRRHSARISTAAARLAGGSCTVCRVWARTSRLCGRRAHTCRPKPLSPMAWAIGAPWSPRPMNPTVAVCWFVVMICLSFPIGVAKHEGRHGSRRQQVKCGVPQALGVRGVAGVTGDACVVGGAAGDGRGLVAVLEVAAADLVQKRGSGQQHGGSRALLDGFLPLLRGLQAAGVLLQASGDGAGIEGICVDALTRPAAGGRLGQQ